jgi:hypothetical protein
MDVRKLTGAVGLKFFHSFERLLLRFCICRSSNGLFILMAMLVLAYLQTLLLVD